MNSEKTTYPVTCINPVVIYQCNYVPLNEISFFASLSEFKLDDPYLCAIFKIKYHDNKN